MKKVQYRLIVRAVTLILIASFVAFPRADGSLDGTVVDPKGAVIEAAQVQIQNRSTGQSSTAVTDQRGRFHVANLSPGTYMVRISTRGFKVFENEVVIQDGRPSTLEARLEIVETRESLTVAGRGPVAPNSNKHYRALRDANAFETFTVNNLVIVRDVGKLTLRTGTISFLPSLLEKVTVAVFIGDGEFSLTPYARTERDYLRSLVGTDQVLEPFGKSVFCFTDQSYDEISRQAQRAPAATAAQEVLKDFRNRMRSRTDRPRSLLEAMLNDETIENIEAELLTDLYNPSQPGFFDAYIGGRKHGDLRFKVRPRGAFPQLLAPEEVALINVDPDGSDEGIWYLGHSESEQKNGKASSNEDKRQFDALHYKIETVIDRSEKLTASTDFTLAALGNGERVLKFGLLPSLRVTRVSIAGSDIDFIQEKQKEDGSFYFILPDAMVKGREYTVKIEYQGNKVIEDAGGGNFAVGARTSWYPSVNAFSDRATFDLTFKVPNLYTLVGVGKLDKEWREGDFSASHWVAKEPLLVAGFNYGRFKKKAISDSDTKYEIEGYAAHEMPDSLRGVPNIEGMSPSRLTENTIVEAQNSIRLFTAFFGATPYQRIAITQQPEFDFGQSWPTLVYLPISAFLDSTQRYRLLGGISTSLTEFIQEVTPHEVAHQWWGHLVGWASFHDQWLSEGFADFSASLYLEHVERKRDKYLRFWEASKESILNKNQYGRRPNDAGPIWQGLRLDTKKNPGAYSRVVYSKGAYVLHMLRWIMFDTKTGDQQFIEMMKDFVKTHYNGSASTEDFKHAVERHMNPRMDLDGNGKMDWFFNQWVYGTEIPKYRLDYSFTSDAGSVVLVLTLTQGGVPEDFKMVVPIYLDFGDRIVRLGTANITGNSSTPELKVKLPAKPKRVLVDANRDILATEIVYNAK